MKTFVDRILTTVQKSLVAAFLPSVPFLALLFDASHNVAFNFLFHCSFCIATSTGATRISLGAFFLSAVSIPVRGSLLKLRFTTLRPPGHPPNPAGSPFASAFNFGGLLRDFVTPHTDATFREAPRFASVAFFLRRL